MDLVQTLLALEQCLMSQATRSNAEVISGLIADDFTEFGASGGVWYKADIVQHRLINPLPHGPSASSQLSSSHPTRHW